MKPSRQRQSGIELLRIIAMAMVVMVHTDFWALGEPTRNLCDTAMPKAAMQYFIESFAIVCVNCFVFISGWFAIKASVKGFFNLIFQIVFYNLLIYGIFLVAGLIDFDIRGFVSHCNFFVHWFIVSYVALYVVSPILNAFIDHTDKRRAMVTVIGFVLLDVLLGWGVDYLQFAGGYSLLHFMVIYLIARYIKVHGGKWFTFKREWDLLIYLLISLSVPIAVVLCYYFVPSIWRHSGRLFLYNSPLVIISSVYFSLFFTKLNFHSRVVNLVGASCFAVFLIHTDNLISVGYLKDFCQSLFLNNGIVYYSLVMLALIIGLFVLAFILDQPRQWLWQIIQRRFFNGSVNKRKN